MQLKKLQNAQAVYSVIVETSQKPKPTYTIAIKRVQKDTGTSQSEIWAAYDAAQVAGILPSDDSLGWQFDLAGGQKAQAA